MFNNVAHEMPWEYKFVLYVYTYISMDLYGLKHFFWRQNILQKNNKDDNTRYNITYFLISLLLFLIFLSER